MRKGIISLFFVVFVTFIGIYSYTSFASSLSNDEKETILEEAQSVILERYSLLANSSEKALFEHLPKTSIERIDKIIERDIRHIQEIGAVYKQFDIIDIWDIEIEKDHKVIQLKLKAEVAKYYQYENQSKMEQHPWLETRWYSFVFERHQDNTYKLKDYVFEDEMDIESKFNE